MPKFCMRHCYFAFAGEGDGEGASLGEEAPDEDDSASDDSDQLLDVERKAREVDRDRRASDILAAVFMPRAPTPCSPYINMVATSHAASLPHMEMICHTA